MRCCSVELLLAALLVATPALAHKSSDAYVHLNGAADGGMVLRVDVALRDLDVALDLDTNGDGKLIWAEVRTAWPAIEQYVGAHLQLEGCTLPAAKRALERRIDGVYAALQWQTVCRSAAAPAIRYSMLVEVDPTHRGIARIEWPGSASVLRVLVPKSGMSLEASATPPATLSATPPAASSPTIQATVPAGEMPISVASSPSATTRAEVTDAGRLGPAATAAAKTEPSEATAAAPLQFLREGMRHILTGYDHVLFLICLLLPSVMRRTASGWQPVDRLAQAVWPVAGIVTAFTIAHSITLALAATGTLSLSPAIIEPAIAVTIILAALDNLHPVFGGRRAIVTFLFGLVHGFGFAGVLAELSLPPSQFAWALLQFNVGLELGQLLIVVVVTILLFSMRRAVRYPLWLIRGGSVAAMAIGALWLVERTANVSILPL